MCKPPSLGRLSPPSSMLVVVKALRRRPPVNKSDRRRARVTSKSHWIPIRVTLQGSQTWMRYRISKCSFMLQTVLDRRYICVPRISASYIFNCRIWAVAAYRRDRLNWGCVYNLTDCLTASLSCLYFVIILSSNFKNVMPFQIWLPMEKPDCGADWADNRCRKKKSENVLFFFFLQTISDHICSPFHPTWMSITLMWQNGGWTWAASSRMLWSRYRSLFHSLSPSPSLPLFFMGTHCFSSVWQDKWWSAGAAWPRWGWQTMILTMMVMNAKSRGRKRVKMRFRSRWLLQLMNTRCWEGKKVSRCGSRLMSTLGIEALQPLSRKRFWLKRTISCRFHL